MSYKPPSKNQEHLTPDRVHELILERWGVFSKDCFDPCPKGTPFKAPIFFNGLYGDWEKLNYVNPPYEVKTLRLFYEKALQQTNKGNRSYMLLPSKTDQDWFHDIIEKNFEIKWIRKRLKFKNNLHHATDAHFIVKISNY